MPSSVYPLSAPDKCIQNRPGCDEYWNTIQQRNQIEKELAEARTNGIPTGELLWLDVFKFKAFGKDLRRIVQGC